MQIKESGRGSQCLHGTVSLNPLAIMTPSTVQTNFAASQKPDNSRLDYLDATRAFALVLGIVFHACLSFYVSFHGRLLNGQARGDGRKIPKLPSSSPDAKLRP